MKNKIERFLIWFRTDQGDNRDLSDTFFGTSFLFQRLINEVYDGKKIKFFNINLGTSKFYKKNSLVELYNVNYFNGHLNFNGFFDEDFFLKLSFKDQSLYVWDKIKESLIIISEELKNRELLEAALFANLRGLENNLNTDYKVLEMYFEKNSINYYTKLLISFGKDNMNSTLIVTNKNNEIFRRDIDNTFLGNEFFLKAYKCIEIEKNNLIIKGKSGVGFPSIIIPLEEILANE